MDDDDEMSLPAPPPLRTAADGVATIRIHGELVNRGSNLDAASGLTSYDALGAALRDVAADPAATAVLLDVDSPGGEAAGAMETASAVRALDKLKPVTAFVNGAAASAAYAIAAGAREIVVAPSATLGSIGVVSLHVDRSAAYAEAGLKPTLIHAGAYKVDGNPMQPLAAGPKLRLQALVDDVYGLFVASVGKHRPALGEAGARATEAGLYIGQKAVDAGLADRVGDLAETLARLRAAPSPSRFNATAPRSIFTGVSEMSDHNDAAAGVQLETETNKAYESGKAAGFAAGKTAGLAEGAASAKARIKGILAHDAAKDRRAFADKLAFDTDLSLEQAADLLAASPVEPKVGRLAAEMAGVRQPDLGAGVGADPALAATSDYDKGAAEAKKLLGLR